MPVEQSELVMEKAVDAPEGVEVPQVKFIDNVEAFVNGREASEAVGALQDLHAKYKYLESGYLAQKQSLKQKIPDMEAALDLVKMLKKKADDIGVEGDLGDMNQDDGKFSLDDNCLPITYNLAENIYCHAKVPLSKTKSTILLWLGANTLLEYTLDEAETLLTTNLKNAEIQLTNVTELSLYVRDQIVTSEVNIARCHNYGVLQRQKQRETEKEREVSEIKA